MTHEYSVLIPWPEVFMAYDCYYEALSVHYRIGTLDLLRNRVYSVYLSDAFTHGD